jgi:ribosomal protein S18 acetylase RimI-like enzyme
MFETMKTEMAIRAATEEDVNLLGQYGADLMQLHHDWDRQRFIAPSSRTPAMYSNYLRSQLGKPDAIVLTAEVDGAAAGYAYAGLEGPDYMALRGPAGVIHDIFVDESRRRQGIGRALLCTCVDRLFELGATQIVLSMAHQNSEGQRLFGSLGFSPTMVEMTLQRRR